MRETERARSAELTAQRQAAARARTAAEEERRLAAQRVAAASRLRQAESATAEAAQRMEELSARRREVAARLAAREADMAPLLPLIERLQLYPAETLLATPTDPETALTGVLVLRGLARQLENDARALRQEQAELEKAGKAIEEQTPVLNAAMAAQTAQAAELDRQIAATASGRREAMSEAEAAARRAADLAERAESLRAVIAAIEAERRAAEARARQEAAAAERLKKTEAAAAARQRQAALARPSGSGTIASSARPGGQLLIPVAGRVSRHWGDRTDAGPSTGITYLAPPAARVVSPCGGRVVFGAPFRSFGLLLIVDCGGGYHAVLAGLDRLDARVGGSVQAGEPVGVMPNWDPKGDPQAGSRPGLYVELRRDGRPVDPAPWLKARS
jgi:septal ring factor EnvC (AmiA/AmiB activator)